MILVSCVNCCHNPLQSDSLGVAVGYCTEHRVVLLASSQTTCGRHLRKDLAIGSAERERELHAARYSPSTVALLSDNHAPANGGYTSRSKADVSEFDSDPVAVAVLDYGRLESKIASLAQLRFLRGVRPELAMLSLARGYVNRCVARGGAWTSGVHLVWWTRKRLLREPDVGYEDIRVESPLPLARQIELAKWSLVMMRLTLISDIGHYAQGNGDHVERLANIAELAAAETGQLSLKRLMAWVKREGVRLFMAALPEDRYEQLSEELRRQARD